MVFKIIIIISFKIKHKYLKHKYCYKVCEPGIIK